MRLNAVPGYADPAIDENGEPLYHAENLREVLIGKARARNPHKAYDIVLAEEKVRDVNTEPPVSEYLSTEVLTNVAMAAYREIAYCGDDAELKHAFNQAYLAVGILAHIRNTPSSRAGRLGRPDIDCLSH